MRTVTVEIFDFAPGTDSREVVEVAKPQVLTEGEKIRVNQCLLEGMTCAIANMIFILRKLSCIYSVAHKGCTCHGPYAAGYGSDV